MPATLTNVLGGDGTKLLPVAQGLTKFWAKNFPKIWKNRSISDEQVSKDILSLLRAGDIDASLADATNLLPANIQIAMKLALDGIRVFQSRKKLDTDGVLGGVTSTRLAELFNCPRRSPADKQQIAAGSAPKQVNSPIDQFDQIFYFVDLTGGPASIEGQPTLNLIAGAWDFWVKESDNIVLRRVDSLANSNFLIEFKKIDGPSSTLGLSHVGGPKLPMRLVCTMDEEETWTAKKFRTAICHEMGHLLGLEHSDNETDLMYKFISRDLSVDRPSANDISRMRAKWDV